MKRKRGYTVARKGGQIIDASEHLLQVRLLNILTYAARPEIYYFAVPNQAKRGIMNAMKMQAEGLKSGVADLCFMFPGGLTAWLEMKKPGGVLKVKQEGFRAICARLGHRWGIAESIDEAWLILKEWDVLKKGAVII